MMRTPILTLALVAVALVAAAVPGVTELLQWDRAALAHGEIWRALTGHLVHFGGEHLLWDAAVFIVLGAVAELSASTQHGVRGHCKIAALLMVAALAISAAIYFWNPHLERYRGLSGFDSALFGWITADLALRARREQQPVVVVLCGAALAGFAAKSIYELNTGRSMFVADTADAFVAVPLAHVVGMVAGVVIRLSNWRRKLSRNLRVSVFQTCKITMEGPASSGPRGRISINNVRKS